MALGLIPSWQFSLNPNINPNVNPYMTIPAGWATQSHPQPLPPVAGLSMLPMAPTPGGLVTSTGLGISNPFDSWWWQHRKHLAIGGAVVLGLGALAAVGALIR